MLRATFELADLEPGMTVDVRETRGTIRFRIARNAPLEQVVQVLNGVAEEVLAGGQWFQLWKGEVVTLDSPENPNEGGTVARIHRGPMVQEGPRRPQNGQANAS